MRIDYLSQGDRKKLIQEIIESDENKKRKEESLRALEVYKGRQAQFILTKILNELGLNAARNSRTISSINLTKKIIKEQASLYKNAPTRSFSDMNEEQEAYALELYDYCMANVKFKKANEVYKLCDQSQLQIVLRDGKIEFRPLYPHHYDVIPSMHNPEEAECCVISSFDKTQLFMGQYRGDSRRTDSYYSDTTNQKIGDPDDYKAHQLFYWWTKDYNFITNSDGVYVDSNGLPIIGVDENDIKNPIGVLPFVDVAADKDFEFYVRSGYNTVNFTIDLGLLLSDVSEISRLQGFSQAIISSVEEPKDLTVGPRRAIWLKISPNAEQATRPTFEFQSPSPDLGNSLQLISNFMSMYLTSQGVSPKLVNASGMTESFTSGVDRFLSMVEKFEASQDDMALFTNVEQKAWNIIKAWNNVYYNVTDNGFDSKLSGTLIPQMSELSVKYGKPEMVLSENDKLATIEKRLDLGLVSIAEAIAFDRGIPKEEAEKVIAEIAESQMELMGGKAETDIIGQQGKVGSEPRRTVRDPDSELN